MVLKVLREYKLYVKISKCIFYQKKIHYLGYIISTHETVVDPEKIEEMRRMVSTMKCDRIQIIHGPCQLLPKIHKWLFEDCKLNHFFEK
jgi:hypothetical protein